MNFLDHILPAAILGISLSIAGCKSTTTSTTNAVQTKTSSYGSVARGVRYAKSLSGLHERKHTAKLKRIVGVNTRRVPWCGYYNAAIARQQGFKPPRNFARAASWRSWGKPVSRRNARPGDHILRRSRHAGSGYHTGVIINVKGGKITACSGNDSNQVRCRVWPRYSHIRRGKR